MRGGAALALLALLLAGAPIFAAEPPATQPVDGTPFFIALSVTAADASAAWYERVLGFEVERRQSFAEQGVEVAILRREDALLELIEHRDARGRAQLQPPVEHAFHLHGVFKFGFLVDDLDAAIARLEALGVPLRGRVIEEADGSFRSLQVEDPDGNVIQLFDRLEEEGP